MTELEPNASHRAAATRLTMAAVAPDQIADGEPHTGTAVFGSFAGLEIGVWEMSAGMMLDTEVDEVFIVITGSARIDFVCGGPPLEVGVGDVVRLAAGTRTRWVVRDTLRKVYIA